MHGEWNVLNLYFDCLTLPHMLLAGQVDFVKCSSHVQDSHFLMGSEIYVTMSVKCKCQLLELCAILSLIILTFIITTHLQL